MNILFLLIPLAVALLALAVWAFLWAVRSGQFEDLEGEAYRILMDDDRPVAGTDPEGERKEKPAGGGPPAG